MKAIEIRNLVGVRVTRTTLVYACVIFSVNWSIPSRGRDGEAAPNITAKGVWWELRSECVISQREPKSEPYEVLLRMPKVAKISLVC
jgi:hypothetical protein